MHQRMMELVTFMLWDIRRKVFARNSRTVSMHQCIITHHTFSDKDQILSAVIHFSSLNHKGLHEFILERPSQVNMEGGDHVTDEAEEIDESLELLSRKKSGLLCTAPETVQYSSTMYQPQMMIQNTEQKRSTEFSFRVNSNKKFLFFGCTSCLMYHILRSPVVAGCWASHSRYAYVREG